MKFIISFIVFVATIAPAAAERGTAAQRAACTPDVFRLCASEIPSVDGIVACLNREKAHLSSACRLAITGGDHQMATRSLKTNADWCDFGGEPASIDEVWRAWCGSAK